MKFDKSFIGRIAVYCIGLLFMAIGVNLSINSNLGVSPVSSAPYAISLVTGINLGLCVQAVYAFFILLQILILRKDFKWINIGQMIFVSIFGYFISYTKVPLAFLVPSNYLLQLVLMFVSLIFIAFGVSLYMSSKLLNLPAEGLTAAIASKVKSIPFHNIKVMVDCSFVLSACIITFIGTGSISGVREGTVIAAITVGKLLPSANRVSQPIVVALCGE